MAAGTTRSRWFDRRIALMSLVVSTVAALALVIGTLAFLASGAALDWAIREAVQRSDGRLAVAGAEGSLLGEIRASRIAWRGPETELEAHDVLLQWSPLALLDRRIAIRSLGARTLVVALKGSDTAAPAPVALGLPVEVRVDQVALGRLDWVVGTRHGTLRGIAFGYEGGAREHVLRDLVLAADWGRIDAQAKLAATAPLALDATLAFAGDGDAAGMTGTAKLGGTLAAIDVDANARVREAPVSARTTVRPFDEVPLRDARLETRGLDLAALDRSLPRTRLDVDVDVAPAAGGATGRVAIVNQAAGTIDAGLVPASALSARFAWDGRALALDGIDATAAGGRARGRARLVPGDRALDATLDIEAVDLARLHAALVPTALSGRVVADANERVQRLRVDLADATRAIKLEADATLAARRVTFAKLATSARDAKLEGSGTVDLDGTRAFAAEGRVARLDPSRFGDFPAGKIDGTYKVAGALAPDWRVRATVQLAKETVLAGVPLAGRLGGDVTRSTLRDADIDLAVAGGTLRARGAAGKPGDRLAVTLDLPKLEALAPLLRDRVPQPLAGRVALRGTVALAPGNHGADLVFSGEKLVVGPSFAAARVSDGRVVLEQGATAAFDRRQVDLAVGARDVVVAGTTLSTVTFGAKGSLAEHRLTLRGKVDDLDLDATLAGGADADLARWRGTLERLALRGGLEADLAAPAMLTLARDEVSVDAARVRFAGGSFAIDAFGWRPGKFSTRGSFAGVPVAPFVKRLRPDAPVRTDVVLGGSWSLVADPQPAGEVSVRRERGDLVVDTTTDATETLAFGITALEGSARLENGRLDAKLRYTSERGGRADADATLGGIDTLDRVRLDAAPLAGRIVAALPSIAVLQPWLGTTAAVDGRVDADLVLRGTFGRPVFAGTIGGQALRMDSPRWGLHFDDGRLAARVDESGVVLDSLNLRGGDGRFEAKGQLARAGQPEGAGLGTAITWRAERLRVLNRPDLRIVASGEGRVELADRHLTLAGRVDIDEGAIAYERTTGATLSPDVVVKGRAPPPPPRRGARGSPLRLDLAIGLGNKLQFTGGGLEARLAGRLALASAADGRLEARGAINAVNGVFYAFGQRLELDRDRARILFDGPIDNPALDIVAKRPNIPVEAGIELTGSVNVPRVTLISNPPMSDGERLAWIITGQGLASSNNAEIAAISAASSALLGRSGMPITTSIARQFGIDDVSIRTGTAVDDSGAEVANPVVTFGKRLSDRLSLVYEQGITVATNTLRLEYALTRAITLRAETGTASGVGIAFRRSFE